MTPDNLVIVLLTLAGAILSLVFTYQPEVYAWYEAQEKRGLIMLCFIVGLAAVYFGLACTPFAGQLHIVLSCSSDGVFEVLKAVYLIATGNQITHLFTKPAAA